jgi:hypothetical protein
VLFCVLFVLFCVLFVLVVLCIVCVVLCIVCVVLCIVCVVLCIVLLPPGVSPIAVDKYIISNQPNGFKKSQIEAATM